MAAVQAAAASSSSSNPQPTPPSVTLTPATPASTDLATLGTPVSPPQETLAEVPSAGVGQDMAQTTNGSTKVDANGAGSSTSPPPKLPPTSSSVAAGSSSTPRSAPSATQKKRKRRKGGFASLLLAFGCLSADDFEEPEKRRKAPSAPSAPAPTSEKSRVAIEKEKPAGNVGEVPGAVDGAARLEQGHQAGTTETMGTTLVGHEALEDKDGQKGVLPAPQVVVAPIEPVNVPLEETAGLTSSAVQPPGSGSELLSTPSKTRRESDSQAATESKDRTSTSGGYSNISESDINETDTQAVPQDEYTLDDYEDEEDRLIAQGGMGIPIDENGVPRPLLPAIEPVHLGRKCLVLDLDETLLHSSFKMLPQADYIVPVEIEGQTHNVYVIKRPGVDKFLREMGRIYEVVVFTASLSKYADPVLDMLDPSGVVKHRLFRESCYNHKGNYVKDLSQLGRDLETSIIIDNSPASYIFHPNNAVPVSTWFNDPHDTELTDLCPFLADLATVDDVRGVLDGSI